MAMQFSSTKNPFMYVAHVRAMQTLDPDNARALLDAVQMALSDAYVHRQQKESAFGINVIRELEILKDLLPFITSQREFIDNVQSTTKRLYDRHTGIVAEGPWGTMTAFLPLMLERCRDENRSKVIITHVAPGADTAGLAPGLEVTHWNGTPIGTYIKDASWQYEGANPYARVALACRSLTIRPLSYFSLPPEDWVTLTTWDGQKIGAVTLPWQIYAAGEVSGTAGSASSGAALYRGVDAATQAVNNGLKTLFAQVAEARSGFGYVLPATDVAGVNPLSQNLTFNVVQYGSRSYGYIRLFSFETEDAADFVIKLCQICALLPETIIIDIRANPGGTIPAGEMALQLFKKETIEFAGLQFRISKFMKKLIDSNDYFKPWRQSFDLGIDTGLEFSQAFPITDRSEFPEIPIGPKKAVLITDALSYSTSDFFAAGFKDNRVGPIIGIDATTGAGGANVWSFNDLALYDAQSGLPTMPPMPPDYNFNLAVRRSLRGGAMRGLPLEGLGAESDFTYPLTREDLLSKNERLLAFAASVADRSF